ncbi:hypothetical protein LEP1GSC008_0632 [Leptospira kirschneri serovar Bulgarica str. Nikolaevo]|uniref:Uncharacterized protein n=1 Tax=Leptospira kirschneri serovar Bulgarica str. Nikolaevo TaxID=1240687 RepID=M6EVI6_9LEPT|nr:hypothetical protein LEP1GSC008_0632 [Leptospira kirschneri serovar Bulgarica str. Nikolaevo]
MLEEAKILPTPVWSMARYADKTISPELSKNPSVWNPPLDLSRDTTLLDNWYRSEFSF